MSKIRVAFLQDDNSAARTLEIYSKMTPGRKGVWKDLVGVTDLNEADFVVVIDNTTENLRKQLIPEKTIYVGAHPYNHMYYRCYDNVKCVAKLDQRDTFGFGEWWLDEDYDTLSALKPPSKTKDLSCILSNERDTDTHRKRIEFMVNFCNKYSDRLDLYGRIHPRMGEESLNKSFKGVLGVDKGNPNWAINYWFGKSPALLPYRHSIELCVITNGNYWGERFFDSMLMWCLPLYYGGVNLERYLPINSFKYIDVEDKSTPEHIISIIDSDFRDQHIKDIAEARDLMLNKYQIWPRVKSVIDSL
jgi:hypothetical protein